MKKRNFISEDCLLICRLQSGDRGAFDDIWQKYSAHVYNFIKSLVINRYVSEDLVQEVFLKVWEKRRELDPEKNFEAYIFTIARNLIYKETRNMFINSTYVSHALYTQKDNDESTQKNIDLKCTQKQIAEIVNQMPPARKNIFILNKLHGLSISDVAERLGISKKTVENQLYQANLFIKENLKSL